MTSKHSFFKCMREDLRHRVWMIALSVLGNFLAILVAFLIAEGDMDRGLTDMMKYKESYMASLISFFDSVVIALGGTIALVGAAIVGLWGFRFVYSKKMVDTYHSLPIKRNTLFWVYYLDGILIWLVPFLACMLITMLIAGVKLVGLGGWEPCMVMIKAAGISMIGLLVGFLLVYHLVLVAVMLSGNVLNTLVTACILGCGVLCVYSLGVVFFEHYMDTFYSTGQLLNWAVYASPIASAIVLLTSATSDFSEAMNSFTTVLNVNVIIMILLGAVAWRLYCKRASELAEQGVKNKVATFLMKLVASVVAGMGGWLIFVMITSRNSVAWGIFGCILTSVMVYGVMDIIFHMDFKAFLANKGWMLVATGLSIFLCLSFRQDWFGYDEYLPKQEKIKEMAFYSSSYTSSYHEVADENGPLSKMQITDQQQIYDFLCAAVDNLDYTIPEEENQSIEFGNNRDDVIVKVTLDSGRSYYRSYDMFEKDREVFLPLLLSTEYAESVYMFDEEMQEEMYRVAIRTENTYINEEETRPEVLKDLMEAYNRDVQENVERVMMGEGRMLVQLRFYNYEWNQFYVDVYETMEHTLAALEKHGYGKAVAPIPENKVASIILSAGEDYEKYEFGDDVESDYELLARRRFGVWDAESLERYREWEAQINDLRYSTDTENTNVSVQEYKEMTMEEPEIIQLTITDLAEIAELMPLLHYDSAYFDSGVFKKYFIRGATIVDVNGLEWQVYIREGELPEKYIEKFAELQEQE